jgi:hypothetical protein
MVIVFLPSTATASNLGYQNTTTLDLACNLYTVRKGLQFGDKNCTGALLI